MPGRVSLAYLRALRADTATIKYPRPIRRGGVRRELTQAHAYTFPCLRLLSAPQCPLLQNPHFQHHSETRLWLCPRKPILFLLSLFCI